MKFHILHDWLPWSEPFVTATDRCEVAQLRKCSICGKAQIKRVSRPLNWYFDPQLLKALWNKEQPK